MIPNEGSYQAALNGQIVIYETEAGATCAAVPLKLLGDVAWSGKSTQTLVKQDGTIQEKTLKNLQAIFGDPTDTTSGIYRFNEDAERPIAEIEAAKTIVFEVVIEHRSDTDAEGNNYKYASVKWLNQIGGGVKMPAPISKKDFLTKHGAKFRALGIGAAVKPKAEAKPVEQPKPVAAPKKAAPAPAAKAPTAAGQPVTATMVEAWERLQELTVGKDHEEQKSIWLNTLAEMFPGKENDDLSIQNWGALKVRFEADFPSAK